MSFREEVYEAVKRIPEGRVATYGQVAAMVGRPGGFKVELGEFGFEWGM